MTAGPVSLTDGRKLRIVRCGACGHEGAVSRSLPTTTKLRCRTCGASWLIQQATGPKPCRRNKPSPAKAAQAAAAKSILERYEPIPERGDRLDDLFGGGQ